MDIAHSYPGQDFHVVGLFGIVLAAALAASIVPFPSELIFCLFASPVSTLCAVCGVATLEQCAGWHHPLLDGDAGQVEWLSSCHLVKI